MTLASTIESLLFVSSQPVSVSQLKKLTGAKKADIDAALKGLAEAYEEKKHSGILLMVSGDRYQLVSHPDNAKAVKVFLKSDVTGELTDPALETLAIVAYRGQSPSPSWSRSGGSTAG